MNSIPRRRFIAATPALAGLAVAAEDLPKLSKGDKSRPLASRLVIRRVPVENCHSASFFRRGLADGFPALPPSIRFICST